jgi:hypothetical protein
MLIHAIVIALMVATIVIVIISIIATSKKASPSQNRGVATANTSSAQPQTTPPPQQAKSGGWFKKLPVKWLVATPVVICLGFAGYYFWTRDNKQSLQRPVVAQTTRAPLEVARRVVCECESGCRQFEEDGKTPLKNKGIPSKGIRPSDAFGKYQFREMHRKPALDLGFDLNTEEGQDRYFAYLYGKEDFGPWDHDDQFGGGRACWGPKLMALGYSPDTKVPPSSRKEEVASKDGEWSPVVHNDLRFEKVRWHPNQKEGCEIRVDEDDQKVFGCGEMLEGTVPKTFSFRHKQNEPMTVEVRFTDPFR